MSHAAPPWTPRTTVSRTLATADFDRRQVAPRCAFLAYGGRAARGGGCESPATAHSSGHEDSLDRKQLVGSRVDVAVRPAVEHLHLAELPDRAAALGGRPRHDRVEARVR